MLPEALSISVSKDENGNLLSCQECQLQKQEIDNDLNRISVWAEHGTAILNMISSTSHKPNTSTDPAEFVFVHSRDIEAWGKAVKHFKKKRKKSQSSKETLKLEALDIFCRPGTETKELTSILPFQLTCKEHKKPIVSIKAFADTLPSMGANIDPETLLDLPLIQLPLNIYTEHVTSMTRLEEIIFGGTEIAPGRSRIFEHSHPRATPKDESTDSTKSAPQNIRLVDNVCSERSCISEYQLYFEREMQCAYDLTLNKESDNKEREDVIGNASAQDTESMKIMVYEFDGSLDDKSSKSSLLKQFDNDLGAISAETSPFRRSTRSRTGVNGRLFEISCSRDINLAQMRLLIVEKSNNRCLTTHDLDIFQHKSDTQEIVTFHLSDDVNDRKIPDILKDCEALSNSNEQKLYVRLLAKSINVEDDEKDINETEYTENLLQIATACDSPVSSSILANAKKSKRPRHERGFQGTFLQSSFHPSVNDLHSCGDSDEVIIIPNGIKRKETCTPSSKAKRAKHQSLNENREDGDNQTKSKKKKVPADALGEGSKRLLTHTSSNINERTQKDILDQDRNKQGDEENVQSLNMKANGCNIIQILYRRYNQCFGSDLALEFSCEVGDMPPIPSDPMPSSKCFADIQRFILNTLDGCSNDMESIVVNLKSTEQSRHEFRNFLCDERTFGVISEPNDQNEFCLSRHEMDILLYGIKQNWSSEECIKLMPYRCIRSVRHVMMRLKKEGITTEKKYEAYMLYVEAFMETIYATELELQNSDSIVDSDEVIIVEPEVEEVQI